VRATIASIVEADNRLVTGTILHRLFNPGVEHNEWGHNCYGLWDAPNDDIVPPPWIGKSFDDTHTHYLASGAAQIDSQDLEDAFRDITSHGYGTKETGSQLLVIANQAEPEAIQGFRAGVASRPSGPLAKFDYIPSVSAPPYLSPDFVIGQPAPAVFNGLAVLGSYGPAFLVESNFVPSGYVAVIATTGPGALSNVVGVRQHPNPAYQGLRAIPGPWTGYPIIESFSCRSFGVGTLHRGAAVAIEVTTNATYTAPSKSDFGLV
jgi:hypothetical protein